eukprot:6424515-Prymnesium_polylepis.1
MGQKGGRGDAKYATGNISNKRGRQLRKSRRVFPRKNRVFQHAHPPHGALLESRSGAAGSG